MATLPTWIFQLLMLLFSVPTGLAQAQYDVSDSCMICISTMLDVGFFDGSYLMCTGASGLETFESCVCGLCDQDELPEVNKFISDNCSPVPGEATCTYSSTTYEPSSTYPFDTYTPIYTPVYTPVYTGGGSNSDSGDSSGFSSSGTSRRASRAGVKAGIGVGIAVGVLILSGLIYFIRSRRNSKKTQEAIAAQGASAETTGGFVTSPPPNPNQPIGYTEKPTPVPTYSTVSTGNQIPVYTPPPQPPMQPDLSQQPQPPQEGLGPRWGEAPTTHSEGPTAGR